MLTQKWELSAERCFDPDPAQRGLAQALYDTVRNLPLICPHGHVSAALLADSTARLGSPADLFIIPDHYVFRMLYSQGVALEELGIAVQAASTEGKPVETDHRRIWQLFADNFHLFRGTPTGFWLSDELTNVFGIEQKLNGENAQPIYDQLEAKLAQPEFSPRALYERFKIEVLCTTDAATDSLEAHRTLRAEKFSNVRPTFRPDSVLNLETPGWRTHIEQLEAASKIVIGDYKSFLQALEVRRTFFKQMGATATDQSVLTPFAERLSLMEAEQTFNRAMRGISNKEMAARFSAHMLMEMARMSTEDGLVMQLHAGVWRNHNQALYQRFGSDMGADIPVQVEWTRNLHSLLNEYGHDPRFRLILFGLDESTYSRELAPLAGHYPAVLLGPPWWFHDSVNGMRRYLDQVMETAGLYNTAGFNDDTRAFASIPARHDVWRRVTCNWLAGQVVRGLLEESDAIEMAADCAYRLAKRAYKLT